MEKLKGVEIAKVRGRASAATDKRLPFTLETLLRKPHSTLARAQGRIRNYNRKMADGKSASKPTNSSETAKLGAHEGQKRRPQANQMGRLAV
jgi:hypothetical protein